MDQVDPRVEELMDREKIRDCLYRYCRGVDRSDEASLRSAYWPDATDQHGVYNGSAAGFIEWAVNYFPLMERGIHLVSNILIEFRTGGAAVETYWNAYQRGPRYRKDGSLTEVESMVLAGRYVDWFEKRGGEWRVATRVVVFDRSEVVPPPADAESVGARLPLGARYPDDPIYALLARA